jgi:hypothetical protein
MRASSIVVASLIAVAGCNGDKGKVDLSPPVPRPTHVGQSGVTCCMITDTSNQHVAYLVNLTQPTFTASGMSVPLGIAGDLHVAGADGSDTKIASNVYTGTYALSPNGKSIFWVGFDNTSGPTSAGTASLQFQPIGGGGAAHTALPSGMPRGLVAVVGPMTAPVGVFAPLPLAQSPEYSPSGKYFFVGVQAARTRGRPADLHVFDTTTGSDVLQRPNGGEAYAQIVMPDDTLVFQDTAGGTSPTSPPVQTLYWVQLPNSAPVPITTRTSFILPTIDNKKVVILKTNGDVFTWDVPSKSLAGSPIATGAVQIAVGADARGPVAWIGADRSVHATYVDGTALVDVSAATAAADLLGPLIVSPDGKDLYYWQGYEQQNNRGTLMHLLLQSGAPPNHVADKVSPLDVRFLDTSASTGDGLVFLQNVDDVGQFGDVVRAARDGSNSAALGQKANVGGLAVANFGSPNWFALHLTNAGIDPDQTHGTVDGSPSIFGGLAFGDNSGNEVALGTQVHASGFSFSDSGSAAVFISGASYGGSVGNYTGALKFVHTKAPSTLIDGGVTGASEISRVVARTLFVNAPSTALPGIYFVKY